MANKKGDDGKEYNADGQPEDGGGYVMKAGKLCKMGGPMGKSEGADDVGLTEEDLQKGLDRLNDFVSSHDATTRKEQLLTKALQTDLDDDERTELLGLMSGGSDSDDSIAEEIAKSFDGNEVMQQAFDVSEYLQEQNQEMVKSLVMIADAVQSLQAQQQEFNLVLAKAMSDQGKLTKAMSYRLGVIERQPAREPKSQVKPGQVMQKSFEGSSGEEPLTRSRVLQSMENLFQKSMQDGRKGFSAGGEDLSVAIATFEQTNQVTPSLLAEVRKDLAS